MAVYPNGQIPLSALVEVQSGLRLTPLAAQSWNRIVSGVRSQFGWTPVITDAYRALDGYYGQEAIFLRRYIRQDTGGGVYNDVRWWNGKRYVRRPGQAAAAVPGTSNHGWATAVDVRDLGAFGSQRFNDFATVATREGWSIAEGRAVNEPWHWTKNSTSFVNNPGQTVGGSVPTVPNLPGIPGIDPVEDDMYGPEEHTAVITRLDQAVSMIAQVFQSITNPETGVHKDINLAKDNAYFAATLSQQAVNALTDPNNGVLKQLEQIRANGGATAVDVNKLAAALAPLVNVGLTEAEVVEAVKTAFREGSA